MKDIFIVLLITLALNRMSYTTPVFSSNYSEEITQDRISLTSEEELEDNYTSEYPSELVHEIKSRILKSLNMSHVPKTHASLPVLQTLNFGSELPENETVREMQENVRDRTKTDFMAADVENIAFIDENGRSSVRFHFNLLPQTSFKGAELWLYKKQDITEFAVTHFININGKEEIERCTTPVSNQTSGKGWMRFDVTHLFPVENSTTLVFEVSKENGEVCLEVEDFKKPFLLIHKTATLKSISKRSALDCGNDTSTCCRKKMYINFKDINWGEWFFQPEGYEANYCKGTCDSIDLAGSFHSQVFMAFCEKLPHKLRQIGRTKCLTCTPTKYESLSVIYLTNDGVQVSLLPNMSVSECGCN